MQSTRITSVPLGCGVRAYRGDSRSTPSGGPNIRPSANWTPKILRRVPELNVIRSRLPFAKSTAKGPPFSMRGAPAQDYSGFGLKFQTPARKSAQLSRAPARAARRRPMRFAIWAPARPTCSELSAIATRNSVKILVSPPWAIRAPRGCTAALWSRTFGWQGEHGFWPCCHGGVSARCFAPVATQWPFLKVPRGDNDDRQVIFRDALLSSIDR